MGLTTAAPNRYGDRHSGKYIHFHFKTCFSIKLKLLFFFLQPPAVVRFNIRRLANETWFSLYTLVIVVNAPYVVFVVSVFCSQ